MKNGLDEQYIDLLKDILENGVEKNTRNGEVLSVFGRTIRYKFKDGKFPLLTTKKMPFKTITTELLWFLKGDTNIKYLVDNNCHIWDGDAYKYFKSTFSQMPGIQASLPSQEEFINKIKTNNEFAKMWGELGPIYGAQWRSWVRKATRYEKIVEPGVYETYIDQIANLINDLKTNSDSRRLMVSAWDVGQIQNMVLPPCHYGFQVYTRELSLVEMIRLAKYENEEEIIKRRKENITQISERLLKDNIPTRAISLMFNMRSCDVPLGLPFNIASYGLLLTLLGKLTNMVPDELIGNLGDTHIYKNQIEGVKEQLNREPFKLPQLNINTEFWPTESGECGIGNIDTNSWLEGLNDWNFVKCLIEEDIQLVDYQYHPPIKLPLSN